MDPALQHLIDEAAIKRVHIRYCRAIDRMDWDLLRTCYHPDGVDDHGSFKGGVEEFIAWLAGLLPDFASTTHFTGNQLVEISGNQAWMESYTRAYHRIRTTPDAPANDFIMNMRYIDQLERRDGEWRISQRVLACESERTDPVNGPHEVLGPDWRPGTRDGRDVSYERLLSVIGD
ncbi:nuclear transport factor 2 family protein [Rhodococcus koreensis]